jgi:hypothetical protein
MSRCTLFIALASLTACVGAFVVLRTQAAPPAAGRAEKDVASEVEKLQSFCDKLEKQNKLLEAHLAKLRKEHESVRDDHKGRLGILSKAVLTNKFLADAGLAGLKKHFEDQNLRVEWRWSGRKGRTGEGGETWVADFDKKEVVEATAVVNLIYHDYGSDEHQVQRILASANVEHDLKQFKQGKVTVRYRALMKDDSNNRAGEIEFIVLARVK